MQRIMKRLHDEDRGFTLIELMVVVLIIAILIAIAIPTFLGARKRAQDRAAQSSVRNILTAGKTIFTDNEDYTTVTVTTLGPSEPSICVTDGVSNANGNNDCDATTSTGPNGVIFDAVDSNTFQAGAYSKSGICFFLQDKAGPVAATTGLGTTYGKATQATGDVACTVAEMGAVAFTSTGWQ